MVSINVTIDSSTVRAIGFALIGYGISRGIIILCDKTDQKEAPNVLVGVAETLNKGHLLVEEQVDDPPFI